MGTPDFPYVYDLGAEWHAWTGLPFVFSRWMVRKDVSPKDLAVLEEALYLGLEEGVDALCERAEPRQDLVMLPRDIATYIAWISVLYGAVRTTRHRPVSALLATARRLMSVSPCASRPTHGAGSGCSWPRTRASFGVWGAQAT